MGESGCGTDSEGSNIGVLERSSRKAELEGSDLGIGAGSDWRADLEGSDLGVVGGTGNELRIESGIAALEEADSGFGAGRGGVNLGIVRAAGRMTELEWGDSGILVSSDSMMEGSDSDSVKDSGRSAELEEADSGIGRGRGAELKGSDSGVLGALGRRDFRSVSGSVGDSGNRSEESDSCEGVESGGGTGALGDTISRDDILECFPGFGIVKAWMAVVRAKRAIGV